MTAYQTTDTVEYEESASFAEAEWDESFDEDDELYEAEDDEELIEPTSSRRLVGRAPEQDEESIQYFLHDIARYKLLSAEEEQSLGKRIAEGDERAYQQLVNSNLRLVVKIAKQYISNDYPFIDVIQDGNLGLMRAARKFEYARKVRFSTYAGWWIKQTIIRNLSMKKRMIRVPHRKEEAIRRLNRLTAEYTQHYGRKPSDDELADAAGIAASEVRELMACSGPVVSMDQPVGEENSSLLDILPDRSSEPEALTINCEVRRHVEELLNELPERERMILSYRFGFEDAADTTLKALGEQLGISAETVRQVEIRVLRKLRQRYPHLKSFLK